ncbi:MAG: DUF6514 family protein [Evtepia sp.]|uniref:DUF6514 family protein n=1 Tax=Evtepia sp. TaxID=2773933 RepID=UPI002A7492CD|nr:DUF6514 family protein [Evtepia sp.]MDY3013854.1 DUF6514 family protein [Evtepia sp.]
MREILIGEADLTEESGRALTCQYRILIRTLPDPMDWESYGLRVDLVQTGERIEILDITASSRRIEALAQLLIRGGVTPCTVREVIEDWL